LSIASPVKTSNFKLSSGNGNVTPIESSQPLLTIGVRDSGVGGLTVARAIKEHLPGVRLLYFADTAHVPYGDRTPEEVRHLALSITQFLIEQGAQQVVFACNTSSAYALEIAQTRFDVPLTGMIKAGALAALEANIHTPEAPIGVMATAATVESHMYAQWIQRLENRAHVIEVPCPLFVPLVESEQSETPAARLACEEYLKPLVQQGVQTVILGCTHYPLLLPCLTALAPQVRFVDPAQFVAREIKALVGHLASSVQSMEVDRFFVSGARDGLHNWIVKLLDNHAPDIIDGPIFTPPSNNL
jgi:glutamate racemase